MRRQLIAGLSILVSIATLAQGTSPSASTQVAPAIPSCSARIQSAHSAGYKDGFNAGVKSGGSPSPSDACSSKFLEGFNDGVAVATTDLKPIEGKVPLQILVEDIPGADSYRFAAAEVINTYFAQHFVIRADAPLYLHISGTDDIGGAVEYEVSLKISTAINIKHDTAVGFVLGHFVLANQGGVLLHYSQEQKTQAVKEKIYAVLSKGDASIYPPPK